MLVLNFIVFTSLTRATCTGLNLTTHIFLAMNLRREHQLKHRDLARETPGRLFRLKLTILLESWKPILRKWRNEERDWIRYKTKQVCSACSWSACGLNTCISMKSLLNHFHRKPCCLRSRIPSRGKSGPQGTLLCNINLNCLYQPFHRTCGKFDYALNLVRAHSLTMQKKTASGGRIWRQDCPVAFSVFIYEINTFHFRCASSLVYPLLSFLSSSSSQLSRRRIIEITTSFFHNCLASCLLPSLCCCIYLIPLIFPLLDSRFFSPYLS